MKLPKSSPHGPIGIFDSGVGGLSVLSAIQEQHPREDLIYLADQAHVPYGSRPLEQVRAFSVGITNFLLNQKAKLIVLACNTASAAALHDLRREFPPVLFVGMEPAVKPAAERTLSGKVGVLATPATFQGELYNSVVDRYAQDVTVLQHTCPGLVAQIETGALEDEKTRAILEEALAPMIEQGVDHIVMGCTHYPFVIPLIREIAGPGVEVIDPAPAVARQVGRLLDFHDLYNPASKQGGVRYLTTSDPDSLAALLPRLTGVSAPVRGLNWRGDELIHI